MMETGQKQTHPDLYNLLNYIDNNTIYSFNQYNRIKGNNINIGYIDTAMVIIPFNLCKNTKWRLDIYEVSELSYAQSEDRLGSPSQAQIRP